MKIMHCQYFDPAIQNIYMHMLLLDLLQNFESLMFSNPSKVPFQLCIWFFLEYTYIAISFYLYNNSNQFSSFHVIMEIGS